MAQDKDTTAQQGTPATPLFKSDDEARDWVVALYNEPLTHGVHFGPNDIAAMSLANFADSAISRVVFNTLAPFDDAQSFIENNDPPRYGQLIYTLRQAAAHAEVILGLAEVAHEVQGQGYARAAIELARSIVADPDTQWLWGLDLAHQPPLD